LLCKALQLVFWFCVLQPIETLKGTEKILKVQLRCTFKIFSGFCDSAKHCPMVEVKNKR